MEISTKATAVKNSHRERMLSAMGIRSVKITAAADIPLDEERTMRFALLRRRLPPPPYAASWLELSAVPTDEMSAGALLVVCERFGAVLVSAGSHWATSVQSA